MTQIDPSLTERQQYWLKHIRACDGAGKPSVEYARENGIEVSAMHSARKALGERVHCQSPGRPGFKRPPLSVTLRVHSGRSSCPTGPWSGSAVR